MGVTSKIFVYWGGGSKVKNWRSLSALGKIPRETIERNLQEND